MIILIGCFRLKLTFSHEKMSANSGKFKIFLVMTVVRFRNLQYPSRLCTNLRDINGLKNNSVVVDPATSGY